MVRTSVLVLAVLGIGGTSSAQQVPLPARVRAAADAISAAQLSRDLDYLSSDALLGRQSPGPGFDSAAAYIARRLQQAGLRPLGDNGSFFQHYDLRDERIDTEAASITAGGRTFRFGDDFVMRTFAGALSGAFPVVYVGHGWTVSERNIDPYVGVDVRGKLLLVHGGDPPRGAGVRQIGRVTPNASSPVTEAQRRGAAGILYIAQESALAGWTMLRRAALTRLEMHPIVPSAYAAPAVTSAVIQRQVLNALMPAGGRLSGAELAMLGDSARHPASFQLADQITVKVPVASSVVHRPYNIVAMIEGSDPALRNEYITIESHLDGAVGRAPPRGDTIYNAADDNATGSAANLAIAEQMIRGPRPRRSLIFIWDSGEERGLWGTRYFVHAPPVPLDRIVAHFNIDMIGASRAPGFADSTDARVSGPNEVYVTGPRVLSASADSLLARVNRAYLGMRFNQEFDRPDHEFFYPRTDAGPFLERGILTIGFQTGLHSRYHLPADEAQYLDPAKMEAIARTVFAAVWAFADAVERPRIDKAIPAGVPRHR
jgi:hypothetical protein